MSDDATPRLSLPYLAAGQAQKHVTLNESLAMLDGLVQAAVESRVTAAQPATPADGALYILPAGATGADWAGKPAGTIMRYESGVWSAFPVGEGYTAYVKDEDVPLFFNGTAWTSFASLITALQNLSLLGVNATANATNKLSVSSAAVLFNHAGAGSQLKVNKNAAGDTASHLFQTGFSGRAEFGLTGDDDFHLKVSADGSTWKDVFTIDRTSGRANFTLSAVRSQTDVFTSSGTYTVPTWARRLLVVCIGAGGGGGSGSAGTNAADRKGGGGGGGGGRSHEWFDVSELAATLSVTVGAGGSGGTGVTGTTAGNDGGSGGATSVSSSGLQILYAAGGGKGYGNGGAGWGARGDFHFSAPGGAGDAASGQGGSPTGGVTSALTIDLSGPGGGSGGGGVQTTGAAGGGSIGGFGYFKGGSGGSGVWGVYGTGGVAPGGAGGAGGAKGWVRGSAGGGGGGAGSAAGNGGAGGAGGAPGGGGGGGGGCRDTYTSGAGGAGGRGEVVIVACG